MSRSAGLKVNTLLVVISVLLLVAAQSRGAYQAERQMTARVDAQVTALDLTAPERGWEKIGWVTDMSQALKLSRKLERPIFVYAMHGELEGRC